MERSILGAIIGSLLGMSTLGGLAFVGFTGSPAPAPPSRPEGDWRLLEPVVYENISLFPVVTSYAQDTSAYLTLDEGLATGEVLVTERGSEGMVRNRDGNSIMIPDYDRRRGATVNQLVLVNRSKRPLLLLAGELVSGGKQDRVIGKDRIVAPFSEPLPLNVFCVEHGRWSSGSQFNEAKTIVHPDNLIWVVVGDRSKIEAGVKELNLGEMKFLDADGKPL